MDRSRFSSSTARLRRLLPWAVAAGILFYLFRLVPVGAAVQAIRGARLDLLLPVALVAAVWWFLLESTALSFLFTRFNAPFPRREARALRALTYLLTPINWHVGSGAMILHLRRSRGVPALEATSSMLFYMLIDGTALSAFVLLGIAALPQAAGFETLAWFAAALWSLEMLTLLLFIGRLPQWRWLSWLKSRALLRTHGLARWSDVAVLLGLRLMYFAGFILFFWAGTRAFSVQAPLSHLAAAVPVILALGGLPVTPAGLGTQQAAMLYVFAPYGTEAQILALGLIFPVAMIGSRLPISLLYLGDLKALRTVRAAAAGEEPA